MWHRFTPYCFKIILVLTVSGCASIPESRHSFTIDEIDGVLTALNKGGPKYLDPLFSYEEVLTLQQTEDETASLLYLPSVILMDEAGFFYIQDSGNYRIAVFSPDGRYSHSVGRQGEGPGEFQYLSLLSVRDDIITVHDSWLQRTSLFRTDGTLIRSVSRQTTSGGRYIELYPGPDDTRITLSQVWEGGDNEYRYEHLRVVTLNTDGDTLGLMESTAVPFGYRFNDQNIRSTTPIHFGARPQAVILPAEGILISSGTEPELNWYDLTGNLLRRIRIDMERETITPEERRRIIDQAEGRISEASSDLRRTLAKLQREHMQILDSKDFWSDLIVDNTGFIWLQKPGDAFGIQAEQGVTHRVLSPDGEYLGDSTWPVAEGWISRGHFLTYQEDADTGEQQAVVYRIMPAFRGLKYP